MTTESSAPGERDESRFMHAYHEHDSVRFLTRVAGGAGIGAAVCGAIGKFVVEGDPEALEDGLEFGAILGALGGFFNHGLAETDPDNQSNESQQPK